MIFFIAERCQYVEGMRDGSPVYITDDQITSVNTDSGSAAQSRPSGSGWVVPVSNENDVIRQPQLRVDLTPNNVEPVFVEKVETSLGR